MAEVVLSVPGMTCRHCVRAISMQLQDVAGVEVVEVDLTSRTVRVEGTAQADALLSAIADAGYEAAEVSQRARRRSTDPVNSNERSE